MKDKLYFYKFYQNGKEDTVLESDIAIVKSVNDFTSTYAKNYGMTVISISQPSKFKFLVLFKKYINVNNKIEEIFYTMELKRKFF